MYAQRKHQQMETSMNAAEMKQELLSREKEDTDLRKRNRSQMTSSEMDELLREQEDRQEKISNDIISIARNLKHNTVVSGKIIKEDIATIEKSTKNVTSNTQNLKKESSRLESHLKKGTNWWLWVTLAIVCATFIFMIFFIRFFPKKKV